MESKDIAKLYGPTQVSVPSHGFGKMVADIKLKRKIGGGDGGEISCRRTGHGGGFCRRHGRNPESRIK